MRVRAHQTTGRRLIQSVLAAALLIVATGTSASASELISITPDDNILRAETGTRTNLAEIAIESDFIGRRCRVDVITQNQSSIHNGNDLIITTGSVETVIADVEAEANVSVDLSTEIVLGDSLSVDLRMGKDRISSLGFSLSLDCGLQETVQTGNAGVCVPETDPATTTTTAPAGDGAASTNDCEPVPLPTTTTTVVPPVEVTAPLPGLVPPTCPETDSGSLTVDTPVCPEPTTTTTVPAPAPTTSAPAPTTPPTTTKSAPAGADTKTSSTTKTKNWPNAEAEVLGLRVDRLPQTAPATAIPKTPNYNG